jgi:hypothetical protein
MSKELTSIATEYRHRAEAAEERLLNLHAELIKLCAKADTRYGVIYTYEVRAALKRNQP